MRAVLSRLLLETRWLIGAYAAIVGLAALDVLFGPIHVGILSVIPLLLIGFFGSRRLALATALLCAVVFSVLDNDLVRPLFTVQWTIETDALFLAVTLIAILLTAERLRVSEVAARSDALTSLPNRRALQERAAKALERAKRSGKAIALLFVDIDGFKEINDRYGHATGDHVLKHVAQRLMHTVRAVDTIGRIGGDEFAVLLEEVQDRLHARRVAEGIESVLRAPYSNGETVPNVGATIGLGMYPADAVDFDSLMESADADMYARKREKRQALGGLRSRAHVAELALELDAERSEAR